MYLSDRDLEWEIRCGRPIIKRERMGENREESPKVECERASAREQLTYSSCFGEFSKS